MKGEYKLAMIAELIGIGFLGLCYWLSNWCYSFSSLQLEYLGGYFLMIGVLFFGVFTFFCAVPCAYFGIEGGT